MKLKWGKKPAKMPLKSPKRLRLNADLMSFDILLSSVLYSMTRKSSQVHDTTALQSVFKLNEIKFIFIGFLSIAIKNKHYTSFFTVCPPEDV